MRIFVLCLAFCTCMTADAQTYTIKSQGANTGNGGAYVAPVVTKTFTLPPAKQQSNPYYAPSASANRNLPGNNTKTVTPKRSGSNDLYTPIQDKADVARNFSCLSGNCENGLGTYQGSPTTTYSYIGNFKDGERHGVGKTYDWEGYLTYEGSFVKGSREGFGKSISYYQEPVFGDGSITRYNTAVQTVFEGTTKNGNYEGEGYLAEYTNRQLLVSIYTGSFAAGKKDGEGVLLLFAKNQISAYYSGGWSDGRHHGIGIDSSEAGLYIGEFKNSQRDGEGTAYWSEYSTQTKVPVLLYTGKWKQNKRDGIGIEYDLKGKPVYEGNFTNDSRNGAGKLFKPDGTATEGVWVNGSNKDLDPPVAVATVASKEFKEDFTDNKRLWPHNSPYYLATVQKGVYHVEGIGGERDYNNFTISVPDVGVVFKDDDWSFEVTAKSGNKHGVAGWYGIGWMGAEFLINPNADLFDFKYNITKTDYKGINSGDAKVKKGYNTFLVIKKGDVIEARLNGKKLYSGPAGDIKSYFMYLIMPKSNPSYGCYADYKEVIFKKLN
jgi:antitoxin component YwqK of YwqJK toxin-antitoxin module